MRELFIIGMDGGDETPKTVSEKFF